MFSKVKILFSLILIALSLFAWSVLIEPGLLIQRSIQLPKWPGPKLKIAFFSDLHAGAPHIDEKYIESLVDRINQMTPDLILIGGDFAINGVIGGKAMSIDQMTLKLQSLKAPLGVFAVLGNHDWWNDAEKIRSSLESRGIQILENQAILIQHGESFNFWLVGIGDNYTKHANAPLALSQVTSDAPRIIFMHDPAALFQVKEKFFATLAGHMHGGQVYIPGIGAILTPGDAPKSWASGTVDFELGSLFVSKGVGTSILPIRLNALPEFVILELAPSQPLN